MLQTEGQWSEALARNNIRAIIRRLRELTAEGEAGVEDIMMTFICWVQRTSQLAKEELLTLCFSRCQGLWMFLDRSSFNRLHLLLQSLRNLLSLAQWARRQLGPAHLWHGMGVPCVPCGVCRDTFGSSDTRRGCWTREHGALKQHIWLGRLVQWWGIVGLLPKYPEAHEVKHISQMWKEMDHSHRKEARHETPGREEEEEGEMERCSSLIQGMVTQLDRQHGSIWTSAGGTDPCYPPPNLQALLKLVLVPNIDSMSVQALLMYFVLDTANFLQCKDDLLQSFCHAFTISSSFSQQIRAFWMLDHGHVKGSMELLLSPRAAAPRLSWQHRCIIRCLLTRKQPQSALRYLHWTRLALESVEDAQLCADVLLQNSCVSEAWALLNRSHANSDTTVMHFLQACNGFGLCAEALKCLPAGCIDEGQIEKVTTRSQLPLMKKELSAGRPPCPLSARLYQAHRVSTVSPEELVHLVRTAAIEVRKPQPKISEVVWPEHRAGTSNSREMFLSTQALRHLSPSPPPMDRVHEPEQRPHAEEPGEERPVRNQPESSSRDLSSETVFPSASCSPLLRQDHPHVYERTLTLQTISSLLTDGENQSVEEEKEEVEEESRAPSSVDALPDCPEQTRTLDGATEPVFVCNLNKDVVVELLLSAEGGELVHGPPHVTDLRSSASSLNQEEQADCIPSRCLSCSFSEGLSCATRDRPTDLHRPLSEDPAAGSSGVSGQPDVSLLTTACGSIFPTQLHVSGRSLTPSLNCNIRTTSAPSGTTNENSPKESEMDELRVLSTSTSLARGTAVTWWKRDLETCRASADLRPAAEPGAALTSDNKRPSLALGQPYSYSLVNFIAKQKGDSRDGKQTDEEEPAGRTSLGTGSRGAMRSGRALLRKGKRGRRA